MKSRHNTRQYQPIVNTTDDTSDALLHARTLAPPVCAAADRPTTNMGRSMRNARRSISGGWCSTVILIVFAAILAVSILPVCTAADWESWSGNRSIYINNIGGSALTDYQINISLSPGINATSLRVVNKTSKTTVPHWNETVGGGVVTELWFKAPSIPANRWCNTTYAIYYGNDAESSASNYDNTFTKTYNNTGLVLELHMDGVEGNWVAVDSSGESNNGTLTNMNVTGNATSGWQDVDGGQWDGRGDVLFLPGSHLRFDGTDDYVDCGNDTSLNFGTGDYTFGFWFKTPDTSTGGRFIIQKETFVGGAVPGYSVFIMGGGELRAVVCDGTNEVDINTPLAYDNDAWHYGSVVWESSSGTLRIYVDGLEKRSYVNAAVGDINSTFSTKIGGTSTQCFDGSIDEVRIYNRALSEDEIYRQYIRSKYAADAPTAVFGTATQVAMTPETNINTVAGQDITFTATLKDVHGNRVDFTAASDVIFEDGNGTWGDNVLVGGRITNNYTTNTTVVIDEVLTVREIIDPPEDDTKSTSTITTVAGAATQVVMTPATDTGTVAGKNITFTATLQDANGNQVDFTTVKDVNFTGGNGSWGDNVLAGGRIANNYTTSTTAVTNEMLTVTENIDTPPGNQTDTSNITTVAGAAATWVVMTPATDTSTVAGKNITFTATLQNAGGDQVDFNNAADVTFSGGTGIWGANALAGGVITNNYTTSTTAITNEMLTVTENINPPAGTQTDTSTITTVAGTPIKVCVETEADGTGTVVGVQNVVSGGTLTVHAITRDVNGNVVANVAATAWSLTDKAGEVADGDLVPEPEDTSAVFTGALVGTAVIHVTSGELAGDSGTITVNGAVNNTNVDEKKVFTAASGDATVTGNFSNNLTGWINITAVGNATNSSEVNQSNPRDGLGSGDKIVSGVAINVSDDSNIRDELVENGTIHIEICYNATTLTALGIDASTLAIWKYNGTIEKWVKQQPSTTTSGGCIYADVKHLCTFALVGSKATDSSTSTSTGGGSGTYPPGWFGTPTPTVTATKAPIATTTATDAPSGERVTPTPAKRPDATKTTTPTATETAKKDAPGLTAVFAIAGLLAVAYAMLRRRE